MPDTTSVNTTRTIIGGPSCRRQVTGVVAFNVVDHPWRFRDRYILPLVQPPLLPVMGWGEGKLEANYLIRGLLVCLFAPQAVDKSAGQPCAVKRIIR